MSAGISGGSAGVGASLTVAAGAYLSGGTGGDINIISGDVWTTKCTLHHL